MALIQSSRPGGSGGGGGGITITGFQVNQFTQATNFTAGSVTLTLSQTPVSDRALRIDYNGDVLTYGVDWSLSANIVTILFADPYVTDYDTPPIFQCQYSY